MAKRCCVDGCQREHAARGFCRAHWKKWKKYGNPLAVAPPIPSLRGMCTVTGCGKKENAKGMCYMHYYRMAKHGTTDLPLIAPKYGPICSIEGCDTRMQSRGFCHKHYKRWQIHGNTDDPVRPLPKNGRRKLHGKARARTVMEQHLCRQLLPEEEVHHKDHDTLNDAIDNLQVLTKSAHGKLHQAENRHTKGDTETDKRCPHCLIVKPRTDFHGQPRCQPCDRIYQRNYRREYRKKKRNT